MTNLTRPLLPMLPVAGAVLAVIVGCSHPQEVDLPPGFSGKVTIFCDRIADSSEPIRVGADGTAQTAVCPRSQETLTIIRDGKAIRPSSDPHWSTTGDGIILGIEFEVH